ncbi:MAG TPA: GWxTD domain-containing protein [Candidatus Kapabacteria bacterium]
MKKYLFILLLISTTAFSQRFSRDSRTYIDYGEPLRGAIYQTPTGDTVIATFNTASTLFSFIKTEKKNAAKGKFYAIRELGIEIRERPAGDIITSKNFRDTIYANTFEETTDKEHWFPYVIKLSLGSSETYAKLEGKLEVRDGFLARLAFRPIIADINRNEFHVTRSLTQKDTSFVGIGDIVLYDNEITPTLYASKNFGKKYGFSKDITGMLPIAVGKTSPEVTGVELTLYQLGDFFEDRFKTPKEIVKQKVSMQDIRWNTKLDATNDSDTLLHWSASPDPDTVINRGVAFFRLAGSKFDQGRYRMEVKVSAEGLERRQSSEFEVEWFDMPLSLMDPKDAVPPMQYIATETLMDSLESGSRVEQMRKLFAYWADRDPSPETIYNERMAEFFKRADYAYFNFAKSARLYDGAMTDRGKIYILYGPPTNIERSFLIGEDATETWTYTNKVKKVFTFTDDTGRGEYKLKDMKQL